MDDGRKVSLVLMPSESGSFDPKSIQRAGCATLYRHKRSRFFKLLYLLGRGATHEGASEQLNQQILVSRRLSQDGIFKRWLREFSYRTFILSFYCGEREMSFAQPPEFRLLWADSGNSVAVLLNGEPWAFVHEKSNDGYSKGILKPERGNVWDQELFEKVFPK